MENVASRIGPTTIPWWPDWRGECCAIIASGPSTNPLQVNALRDRIHVIAIKSNVDLAPWADVVYGCDDAWWVSRNGLTEFKGLKITYGQRASEFQDMKRIDIDRTSGGDRIMVDRPALIGSGGNSGFQALNLAVQFGATGILLIGYDMTSTGNSPHWYGRNNWPGSSNPIESNYERWRKAYGGSISILQELGVDVVNASPSSALNCYRRATVLDAMKGWGL
jgi:hypothetical protein